MRFAKPHITLLIVCQLAATWLETYLISKISFIGKVGIATIHKEYRFLRSGWKTFCLLFGIQLLVIIMLQIARSKFPRRTLVMTASALMLVAAAGLFITFLDFLTTYTHRLLKERFHLGFYLFWLGWMGSCIAFLVSRPPVNKPLNVEPFPQDPNTIS